mgnify:CR=1 FL=1
MGLLKLVDCEVIGYDKSFEAPLLAQDLRQQLMRGGAWHAVQLIVPVHNAVETRLADCGLEGAQDWDLALRVSEGVAAACIRHIPRVLYHWRTIAGSAAAGIVQKSYAGRAQQRALEEHLARQGIRAQVVPAVNNAFWRVQFPLPAPRPLFTKLEAEVAERERGRLGPKPSVQ